MEHSSDIKSLNIEVLLADPVIDFDTVFETAITDKNIDSLYKKTISDLRELIDSGEVDSVSIQSDLNELMNTLLSAKNSSGFSKILSAQFAWTFVKQLGKGLISESKLGDAFVSSLDELGVSSQEVISILGNEIQNVANSKTLKLNRNFLQIGGEERD